MRLRIVFSSLMVATAAAMTGCGLTGGYNLPPASRLMEPGPGVGGPGPGVLSMPSPGVVPATFVNRSPAGHAPAVGSSVADQSIQVLFAKPDAMQISYDAGGGGFDSVPLITPARQNFSGGGVYRLKLTGIPAREGTELYPTIEIGPVTRRSSAYLAHNAIPVQFTEEDFDQVMTGNFVTKVIYLPDPDFQELALAGVETLVSTRLDPGMDPIVEASRRGVILAVIRMGNKDIEVPGAQGSVVRTAALSGSNLAATAPGSANVVATGFLSSSGCDAGCDGGCGPGCGADSGCDACGGIPCSGACSAGPANYYGPHSTPRGGHGPGGLPAGLVGAGQYGMPISGTPIGLPGPPHVPLGTPAGLQKHVMHNWTKRHIPDPVSKLKINVKQRPGLSYPQPASRAWVVEDTIHSSPRHSHRHFGTGPAVGGMLGNSTQSGGGHRGHVGGGGLLQSMKQKLFGGKHH